LEAIFRNLALISGVLVTVVNGLDKFFDYRTAWVKQIVTVRKLSSLYYEIEFYELGLKEKEEADEKKLAEYMRQYQKIWEDIMFQWSEGKLDKKKGEKNEPGNAK